MSIQILGTFPTEQEAITAVEVHALAGHRADKITLFSNIAHAKSLGEQTHVNVKADQPMEDDETGGGWMDKVKGMFSHNEDFDLHTKEHLVEFGLTETEAAQCLSDVEAGNIVVLADDEIRMGHDEDVIGT